MSDLIVTADAAAADHSRATLGWAELNGRRFRCALGRSGIVSDKREGDGGTPIGSFALRRLFVRADKGRAPKAPVPVTITAEDDGWCDAPEHPHYNKAIKLPFSASHEKMWREDHVYDLVLVIGHNDNPPLPFKGSAVFVHLAHTDYRPTEGCIAFSRADLETILGILSPNDQIVVKQP